MAQEAFPLHYLVWNNQYLELDRELQKKEVRLDFVFWSWWLMMGFFFFGMSNCIALMLLLLVCLVLQQDLERLDPRGRTPLELAVCLGHLESTRVLLRHSADPTHCNAQGWTSECSAASLFPTLRLLRERETPSVNKCMFQSCRRQWARGTLSLYSWCFSTETSSVPLRDWRAFPSCSAN